MTRPLHVVAHEATRTGAPRVLLSLLDHLRPQLDRPLSIELLRGGALSADLLALADVPPSSTPAAVVVNGSLAARAIDELHDVPAMIYVHEDGQSLEELVPADVVALRRYDMVLCVSARARDDLGRLGVERSRITVLPPVLAMPAPDEPSVGAARAAMSEDPSVPLIVGCGEAGWRKGADLFLQVASSLRRTNAAFAWIGPRPRGFARLLDIDQGLLDLPPRVRWCGATDDVGPMLAAADVLVAPTRRDARPLTPLEAALVGTPTVGFAIGGLIDLAGRGAVATVPFPDTTGMARVAEDLCHDLVRARSLVEHGREVAAEQSIEVIGPRFTELVLGLLGAERAEGTT